MEIKQYIDIILKRIWLIAILPVIAALCAAYFSYYLMTPMYESNTTLYVINKNSENPSAGILYSDLQIGQALVKDYRELVKSRLVTNEVINQLGLEDITASQLAGQINVQLKNDTRIIEITVKDADPEKARDIADKVGEVFTLKVVELMKADNVEVVDTAEASGSPVEPRPLMNTAIAFLVGLMAAIGIAILIDYLDDSVKGEDDIEKQLGLTVLGTIPTFNLK